MRNMTIMACRYKSPVLFAKWYPTFLRVVVVLSYSGVEWLPLEDEGTTMFKNG
jgi:hypothetical protein